VQRDLSSLRRALHAMAPMPQDTLERCLDVFGCDSCLLLGQPEMSPTTTIFRPEHQLSHPGGWFHSGDVGHLDADALLRFTDRRKDVITSGGENVASIEVEKAVFAADPGITEVLVVGLPHEHWSEAITAFVVPAAGVRLDGSAIRRAMRGHIEAYKIPTSIVVVDQLPRTSTGKVQTNVVRDAHADHCATADSSEVR